MKGVAGVLEVESFALSKQKKQQGNGCQFYYGRAVSRGSIDYLRFRVVFATAASSEHAAVNKSYWLYCPNIGT